MIIERTCQQHMKRDLKHWPISRVGHCCMRARLYKYTHTQTVFRSAIVINRTEDAYSVVIIKHKYMLMCNHKIRISIMLCLLNSAFVEPRFHARRANAIMEILYLTIKKQQIQFLVEFTMIQK